MHGSTTFSPRFAAVRCGSDSSDPRDDEEEEEEREREDDDEEGDDEAGDDGVRAGKEDDVETVWKINNILE